MHRHLKPRRKKSNFRSNACSVVREDITDIPCNDTCVYMYNVYV